MRCFGTVNDEGKISFDEKPSNGDQTFCPFYCPSARKSSLPQRYLGKRMGTFAGGFSVICPAATG